MVHYTLCVIYVVLKREAGEPFPHGLSTDVMLSVKARETEAGESLPCGPTIISDVHK